MKDEQPDRKKQVEKQKYSTIAELLASGATGVSPQANAQNKVYEVVDATNDETYFTLGIFSTPLELLEKLARMERKDLAISELTYDDYEKIEIREREFGWTETGKTIITISRRQQYDETIDKYIWQSMIVEQKHQLAG